MNFSQYLRPKAIRMGNAENFTMGNFIIYNIHLYSKGGLGVTCSPRDPRFAGSNPAEVDGFFQDVKILSTSPPGGTLGWRF